MSEWEGHCVLMKMETLTSYYTSFSVRAQTFRVERNNHPLVTLLLFFCLLNTVFLIISYTMANMQTNVKKIQSFWEWLFVNLFYCPTIEAPPYVWGILLSPYKVKILGTHIRSFHYSSDAYIWPRLWTSETCTLHLDSTADKTKKQGTCSFYSDEANGNSNRHSHP